MRSCIPTGLVGNKVRNGDNDRCLRFVDDPSGRVEGTSSSSDSDSKIPRLRLLVDLPRGSSRALDGKSCEEGFSERGDGASSLAIHLRNSRFTLSSNGRPSVRSSSHRLCAGGIGGEFSISFGLSTISRL